eukprot:Skav201811  [mRNA]  locus=scaffold1071:224590:229173:- [translate_table: standard]
MSSHIGGLISSLDAVGMVDGTLHATTRTLLFRVDERKMTEDDLQLIGTLFSPEGFGSRAMGRATMDVPPDREFLTSQRVFFNTMNALPALHQTIWIFDAKELDCAFEQPHMLEMCYEYTTQSSWTQLPDNHMDATELEEIRTIEMFVGGFGGWKAAWGILSQYLGKPTTSLAIELHDDTAKNYAIAHDATYIPANADLDAFSLDKGHWILQCDMREPKLKKLFTRFRPNVVTISSPCPPWSTASRGDGLATEDGQLLPLAIGYIRWSRPTIVLIEQVAGFRTHSHFTTICDLLILLGYTLLWHKVVNLADQAQPVRCRWLGLAVRVRAHVKICPFQMWPASTTWGTCKLDLPRDMLQDLYISDEVARVAGDFRYVKNPAANMSRHAADVIALRIYDACDQLPTFMARYGSQHQFSHAYLEEYGYFGFFLKDTAPAVGCRFFAPAEIAVMHGIWEKTFLPTSLVDGWLIIGNQISIPHALLMCGNALRFLGLDVEISEIFPFYHERKLTAHDVAVHTLPGGYMLMKKTDSVPEVIHDMVAELWGHRHFAPTEFWTPQHGLCDTNPMQAEATDLPASALTQSVSAVDDASPEDFTSHAMLKAHVQFDDHHQEFWFSPHLRSGDLEWIWEFMFLPTFDIDAVPALRFHRTHVPSPTPATNRCIRVLHSEGHVSVIECDPDRSMIEQAFEIGVPVPVYDCFGPVGMWSKPEQIHMLLDFEIPLRTMTQDVIILACAFAIVDMKWTWNPTTDVLHFLATSYDATAVTTVTHAVAEVLNPQAQDLLGRTCEYTETPGELEFRPTRQVGVLPTKQFRWVLAISFARMALQALSQKCPPHADLANSATKVRIMFDHRHLWTGLLDMDSTLDSMQFLLRKCLSGILGDRRLRIAQGSGTMTPNMTLRQCEHSVLHEATTLELLQEVSGGGNKAQLKTVQQTALASALLDKGYPLSWVTKTVDRLVSKFSIQRIQATTAMPVGSQRTRAIEDMCAEADITMPQPQVPQSRAKQTGLPWSKAKKQKLNAQQFDVSTYSIVAGFFTNTDDSEAPQIHEMRPQSTGVCLMQQCQAQQWLQAESTISPDELAIVVPGRMEVPSQLTSIHLTVPCMNDAKEMVLIQGTLIQMGAKTVKHKQGSQHHLPASGHLISLTLHKEDWSEFEWNKALEQTNSFIRERLAQDDLDGQLQALWGKSLRCKGAPCSPLQATTIQMHGTIEASKLPLLLKCSGFNRLFVVPKSPEGRIANNYRIVWLQGDLTHATCVSAQLPDCLGLVRGKSDTNFGLRFGLDRFPAAWKHINPNVPVPAMSTGAQIYKVEGLPFGCTKESLAQWLQHMTWDANPMRALGPNTWLLKADDSPPQGIHMYNGSPVLIRLLPPRTVPHEKILLGRPSKPQEKDPWVAGADPWQGFRGITQPPPAPVNAASRQPPGPIEARFQAQDATIRSIQTELAALTQASEQRTNEIQQKLAQVDQTQQIQQRDFQQALHQVRSDLDTTLTTNLKQHSSNMDNKFDELKQLVLAMNKRGKPAKQEDEDVTG